MVNSIKKSLDENENLGLSAMLGATGSGILTVEIKRMTAERRTQLVKLVKEYGERGRKKIRDNRKDYMDLCKKCVTGKFVGKDDGKRREKEGEEIVKKINGMLDKQLVVKEKEIMG